MRNVMLLLSTILVLASACGQNEPPAPPPREAIDIQYVGVQKMNILAQPQEGAAVITAYGTGETVSVYSRKGDWVEVGVSGDQTGWVHASDLVKTREEASSTEGKPRFRVPPSPVFLPGSHGQIDLEASVNAQGDVVDVKVRSNTTGSKQLEALNVAEFRKAKFFPMLVEGSPKPFVYDHHISY